MRGGDYERERGKEEESVSCPEIGLQKK